MATEKEKKAALALLLGDDVVEATLKTADDNHRTAEGVMRLAYKEHQEKGGDGSFGDWLLNVAIDVAQKEEETLALKAKKKPKVQEPDLEEDDEEEEEEMDEDEYPVSKKEFRTAMAELKTYWDKKTSTKSQKEADTTQALAEVSDAHNARIAKMEATVKAQNEQLQATMKELAELKGEQPPAVSGGVRPSQSPDNVVNKEAVMQAPPVGVGANGDYQEFLAFMGGKMNGGQ